VTLAGAGGGGDEGSRLILGAIILIWFPLRGKHLDQARDEASLTGLPATTWHDSRMAAA